MSRARRKQTALWQPARSARGDACDARHVATDGEEFRGRGKTERRKQSEIEKGRAHMATRT